MKEHGLLFSAPMARANVDDRKTVTRRMMNPQPPEELPVGPFRITVADPKGNGIWRKAAWEPGDLIYQKETWAPCNCGHCSGILYRASNDAPVKWKSSLFLRKVDARFWAEVVSVRVERLQEITEEDAKAEGVEWHEGGTTPRQLYRFLWKSLNGPGSWDANPWVWRIEYRRVER